jgi:hypothetical protein
LGVKQRRRVSERGKTGFRGLHEGRSVAFDILSMPAIIENKSLFYKESLYRKGFFVGAFRKQPEIMEK